MNFFESEQEANELIKLIDLAVKSGGLQVAAAGNYFFEKIKKQFEIQKSEETKTKEQE